MTALVSGFRCFIALIKMCTLKSPNHFVFSQGFSCEIDLKLSISWAAKRNGKQYLFPKEIWLSHKDFFDAK